MSETTFSPFTSKRTQLASRRRKIAKACDFCREHRVRCESTTPCPQCVANNVACLRSRPSVTPRKRHREDNNEVSERPFPVEESQLDTASGGDSSHTVETSAPTPSPEENLAWSSHKTDSILGFIARINAFCSGISQLSPEPTPPGTEIPSSEQRSAFPSAISQEANAVDCDLTSTQVEHLMRIFWARIRPQMPIVEWKDIKPDGQTNAASSPLLDAVTAYALQYIHHSGLHNRLVGLKWPQFQRRARDVGLSYFRRCLSAVTQLTTFAGPSLSVMQCYCYLISYLLDAGQHQAAYNMAGLALRISHSLNYMDARNGGYQECQLFRRVWWTLIHLDFRCSRHVGKPVAIQVEELMCLRPTREPQDVHITNGLLYHTESIRLTAAALLVNEAVDRFSLIRGQTEKPKDIEARAQNLTDNLSHLQEWREQMPKENSFAKIKLDVPDIPTDQGDVDILNENLNVEQPEIETLLSTLLMLQYHNIIMSLHRVFIQFPSYPLIPKAKPKADAHAASALNHAMKMIEIAHCQMVTHEIFYGLTELYQYQWNAVITIIGFMLAYPYCHRCAHARNILNLALEIFDSADEENGTAVRARALTRHLCSKVDTLVQILNMDNTATGQPTPGSSAPSDPPVENQSLHGLLNDSASAWPNVQSEGVGEQGISDESLWSWADFINLDAWPSYCDEVNGAFMDTVDFAIPGLL